MLKKAQTPCPTSKEAGWMGKQIYLFSLESALLIDRAVVLWA